MSARLVAIALLGLGYVAGCHWLMTAAPATPWNAVAVLAPMLAAASAAAWKAGQRRRGGLGAALVAGLFALAAAGVAVPAPWLYLGQHVGVNGLIGLWFATTLRRGAQPLISGLAERVHGRLTPAMRVYTRHVTQAWVAFFAAMVVLSVALFAAARFEVWAAFANLATPLGVAAMFMGERLLRYRLHPEFTRSSVMDAVRAWRRAAPADRAGHAAAAMAARPHDIAR